MSMQWMRAAACATRPKLPWTGKTGKSPRLTKGERREMRAVCADCPVRLACLAYIEAAGVNAGFWAGAWRDPRTDAGDGLDAA